MKVYSVVVLFAVVGLAYSLPANKYEEKSKPNDPNKDVDFVPLGNKNSGAFPAGGVIDVDASSFFGDNPFGGNPFSSAFNGFEGALTRMRNLLEQFLGKENAGQPGVPDFPELHIPNFGNVDLGKGNTTSVTKIINGHKVTINDTEYKSDEANGSSFFKVHIVEVHPDGEDSSTTKDVVLAEAEPEKPEVESVEETNNEIPKIKDNEGSHLDDNIETLDEADMVPPQKLISPQLSSIESFEDNRIDSAPQKVHDLSNDIYINQLMADAGAKTNPDAEVFESLDGGRIPSAQYYPQVPSSANRIAPFSFYPTKVFEQRQIPQEAIQQFHNLPFYGPPMAAINDPYYNRYQPEQIMFVPLDNDRQVSYSIPSTHATSSSTRNSNSQTAPISSYTTPDKFSSTSTRT